jgi:hypothetical protein
MWTAYSITNASAVRPIVRTRGPLRSRKRVTTNKRREFDQKRENVVSWWKQLIGNVSFGFLDVWRLGKKEILKANCN